MIKLQNDTDNIKPAPIHMRKVILLVKDVDS